MEFRYTPAELNLHERLCIELRISDSGDEELDTMIRQANRRDAAVAAMQGLMPKYIKCWTEGYDDEYFAMDCVRIADALIARLEESK